MLPYVSEEALSFSFRSIASWGAFDAVGMEKEQKVVHCDCVVFFFFTWFFPSKCFSFRFKI